MAVSPGADFVVVTRNSMMQSRNAGLFSTMGIGLALWVHVAYSIAGLAILINSSPIVFTTVRYLGGAYLVWLGWQSLRSSRNINLEGEKESKGLLHYFQMGFLCNLLNPKVTMFFLSIFTQVVDSNTPLVIQLLFGLIISFMHVFWFSLVCIFITKAGMLNILKNHKNKIDNCFGVLLILFGLCMTFTGI